MSVSGVDELYGVAPERFVAERGALAKALRGKGERDEAKRVAALRKPSVAAWAVNQLARAGHPALAELFIAGDELSRIHAELLDGRGDAAALREAVRRERDLVELLTDAARELASGDGTELSAVALERVSETLDAAARDQPTRELVSAARLEREHRIVGFGAAMAGAPSVSASGEKKKPAGGAARSASPPAPRERRARAATTHDENARTREERERDRGERERAAQERAERDAGLSRAEAAAKDRAKRSLQDLKLTEEQRDRAAQALEDAEAALVRAWDDRDRAAQLLEDAQAAVGEARQNADAAIAQHHAARRALELTLGT